MLTCPCSVGRDVIPFDLFAKIVFFFTLFDGTGVLCTKIMGFKFSKSNFQKLSIEPIDRQRATQHNIQVIDLGQGSRRCWCPVQCKLCLFLLFCF